MIAGLKPYPAMKDSGVPWLGEVPEHWEVLPNRALFTEVKERDHPEEQMLSVTITKGVIRQQALLADSSKKDSSNQDKSAYKLVQPGDIAYNKMRAWQGAVGVSDYQGIVSPAYVVQRPRKGVQSHFVHYLLRTPAFAKEAERWSYGITSDMWSLRPEHFKMIYGCLPPLPEQAAIVRFLDYMDRRIRRYIRAKQKLIKLLEEQKQAIIHHAVTRGLDANVQLKPSGVEWLGDLPEGWRVVRIKYLGKIISGFAFNSMDFTASGVRVLKIANVKTMSLDWTDESFLPEHFFEKYSSFSVRDGDLVIALTRPIISTGLKAAVAEMNGERVLLNQRNAVFRACEALRMEFMYYLVFSRYFVADFENRIDFTGQQPNISPLSIGEIAIALPQLDKQDAIVAYLKERLGYLNRIQEKMRTEITLFLEYRTRLIADVVTGKLDVREAAARLPKEPRELEPLDEADAVSDVEEDADKLGATLEEAEA